MSGPSFTFSPSIDQGAALNFQNHFHEMTQQVDSKLVGANAITWLPSKGKTNELARIGRLELSEVNSRNPDKVFSDYAIDNRLMTKRRFTKTIQIDAKQDINELIADPTSPIISMLKAAQNRMIDRVGIAAAVGPVLVGQPDAAPTSITAAQDGVVTIDATSGMTYDIIQAVTQNYVNNDVPDEYFMGSTLAISGKENAQLMGEIEFINNLYMGGGEPVNQGVLRNAGTYKTVRFAGTTFGSTAYPSPILPEPSSTTRQCVVLAPNSIAMAMELAYLGVDQANGKVNSKDITVDFWLTAMRVEGALVQILTTTI